MATVQPLDAEPTELRRTADGGRDGRVEGSPDERRATTATLPGREDAFAGDAVLEDRDVERILIAI